MAKKHDTNLVYYGPHPCQKCDKDGAKGTSIVKAGNNAHESLEFDFPEAGRGMSPIAYPNTQPKLRWRRHKHIK